MPKRLPAYRRLADAGFLLFLVLCVLAAGLGMYFHGERLEREAVAAHRQFAAIDARRFEDHVTQTLNTVDLTLESLLETDDRRRPLTDWNRLLADALWQAPHLRSLSLLDSEGRVVASSNPANLVVSVSLDRFLPQADPWADVLRIGPAQAGRDLHDGRPLGEGELALSAFIPVVRQASRGQYRSVALVAALNTDYFINHISARKEATRDWVDVLAYDGSTLLTTRSAPAGAEIAAANRALAARWRAGEELGGADERIPGSGRFITAWRLARNHPVAVVTRTPHGEAVADARAETRRYLVTLLPLVCVAIAMVLVAYVLLRRAGDQLVAQQAREIRYFSTLLDTLPANVLMLDARGDLLVANKSWREFAREQRLTLSHADAPLDLAELAALFEPFPEAPGGPGIEAGIRAVLEGRLPAFDCECSLEGAPEPRWFQIMVRPFRGERGSGVVVLQLDVTRRHEAEERLRLDARVFAVNAEAIVVTDARNRIVSVNPAFTRITGYAAEEVLGSNPSILGSGIQDQRFYRGMWRALERDGFWQGEIVNRHKSGHLYPELLSITVDRGADGSIRHYIGVFTDITARKAADTALDAARARLATIIASFQDAVLVEDQDGRVVLANERLCETFALPWAAADLVGMKAAEVTTRAARLAADPQGFLERVAELRDTDHAVQGEEIALANGRTLERDFVPIVGEAGFLGYFRAYRDITERKQREQELRLLATTDPLTGVLNRRAFMERMERELLRARRHHLAIALLMLDLDHFKRVNDRWGHAAGDLVLQRFAALLGAELRRTDALGRLGGEEFAVVLPETGEAGARELAERVRARVAATAIPVGEETIAVTVSIGIALYDEDATPEAFMAQADAALYLAKSRGRNRVERAVRA